MRDDPADVRVLAQMIESVVMAPAMLEKLTIAGVCAAIEWAKARLIGESFEALVNSRTRPAEPSPEQVEERPKC